MWLQYQVFIVITGLGLLILAIRWYFRKFTEELGKQTAELIIIRQKTLEVESVKKAFNEELEGFKKKISLDIAKEIEPLKASLSKENIAYQIYTAEYIKMRFERLDELYARLHALEKNFREVFDYSQEFNQQELIERHGILYRDFYKPAEESFAMAFIYISDDVSDSVKNFLDENKEGVSLAAQWYTARHISKEHRTKAYTEKFIELDDERRKAIKKVSSLLKEVEVKFKRNLTIA